MTGLAPRQRDILKLIAWNISVRGYPPSIREIGRAAAIASTNGVRQHLGRMKMKGLINWEPMQSRTLTITEAGRVALAAAANKET